MNRLQELIASGFAARRAGEPQLAKEHFRAAIASPKGSDRTLVARAHAGLGQIERDLGNLPAARAEYETAVCILRDLEAPLQLAHTIRHVGDILSDEGLHALAIPHYDEALAIYAKHTEVSSLDLANAVAGYARAEQQVGNRAHARLLWQQAKALYQDSGVPAGVNEAESQLKLLAED